MTQGPGTQPRRKQFATSKVRPARRSDLARRRVCSSRPKQHAPILPSKPGQIRVMGLAVKQEAGVTTAGLPMRACDLRSGSTPMQPARKQHTGAAPHHAPLMSVGLLTLLLAVAPAAPREHGGGDLCCLVCGGWAALLVLTCPPCSWCAAPLFWLVGESGGECCKGGCDDLDVDACLNRWQRPEEPSPKDEPRGAPPPAPAPRPHDAVNVMDY